MALFFQKLLGTTVVAGLAIPLSFASKSWSDQHGYAFVIGMALGALVMMYVAHTFDIGRK